MSYALRPMYIIRLTCSHLGRNRTFRVRNLPPSLSPLSSLKIVDTILCRMQHSKPTFLPSHRQRRRKHPQSPVNRQCSLNLLNTLRKGKRQSSQNTLIPPLHQHNSSHRSKRMTFLCRDPARPLSLYHRTLHFSSQFLLSLQQTKPMSCLMISLSHIPAHQPWQAQPLLPPRHNIPPPPLCRCPIQPLQLHMTALLACCLPEPTRLTKHLGIDVCD
jgi:hypothetical protein